jgi:hypothetical protein
MSNLLYQLDRSTPWLVGLSAASILLALNLMGCDGSARESNDAESSSETETPINTLTEEERAAGWQLLFDGESFDGWRGVGRDSIPEGHWTIEDGTLHKIPSGDVPRADDGQPLEGGDIMTIETFENFELSWEWKTTDEGNSGIKYNVSEEVSASSGSPHGAIGFEYQMLDDDGHPAADREAKNTTGGLYDLISARPLDEKNLKPVGEWNHSRIILEGNHGEHWLNGQKQVEYELGTSQFDSLVAASKFADIEGFADKRAGHIVIQDHTTPVWIRNIKIRELE